VERLYQIADARDSRSLQELLVEHGEALVPLVELIEGAQLAVDEFVEVLGRASLGAVLELSAQRVAGPKHQGKAGGEVRRHGHQPGTVCLSTQKVRVDKPRLRRKGKGRGAEVPIPAYEAMQRDGSLSEKLCAILMRGVSTRNYEAVVPEMAESCGVSKSSVSREFTKASAAKLKELCARRFDDVDLLVIYIDGVQFGGHHVIGAIGVDVEGHKHVLGVADGASESTVVVKGLLEDLVERGVDPGRRRLFVIDGSKALRKAIDAVFGSAHPVQRCRAHKERNVVGHLPEELGKQVRSVMKAAWRLDADEGLSKLRQQARWLRTEHPSAAASLLEGVEEMFTINRLGLPARLRRCLGTTNIVESPTSGVRLRTGRVTNWQHGEMVLRWAATAYLETERNFRKIIGHQELWMLKAVLDEDQVGAQEVVAA